MKQISFRVDEEIYNECREISSHTHRPVSMLIRQALEEFLEQEKQSKVSIFDLKPYSVGKILVDVNQIDRSEIFDEMIEN